MRSSDRQPVRKSQNRKSLGATNRVLVAQVEIETKERESVMKDYTQAVRRTSGVVATILMWYAMAGNVKAQTNVTVGSAADTGMDSFYQTASHGDWGALDAGSAFGAGVEVVRGLFSFDLSSIPTNAIVLSASFHLAFTSFQQTNITTLSLYRMTTPWTESGATWLTTDGSTPWGAPGAAGAGDHAAMASTSLSSGFVGSETSSNAGFYTFSGAGLVADVQNWINNPSQNDGWILLNSDEVNVSSVKQFWTKEYLSAYPAIGYNATPFLAITYIPEPAATALVALGLGACCWLRRRR